MYAIFERTAWLDWVRCFAVFCIVFCHATETVYQLNLEGWNQAGNISRYVRTVCFTVGRLGVPLFLFLSGYLLLSRHKCGNLKEIIDFIKTKWVPLFACYEIWVIIYNLFLYMCYGKDINILTLFRELALMQLPPFVHLWYMPMILGIYLFLPFISFVREMLGDRVLLTIFVFSLFSNVLGRYFLLDLSFLGSCYVTYVLWGGVFKFIIEPGFERRRNLYVTISTILFSISFVYVVLKQMHLYEAGVVFNVWYNEPGLIMGALMLPSLFISFCKKNNKITKEISIAGFAIYLMHNLFLVTVCKYVAPFPLPRLFTTLLLCGASLILSFLMYKLIKVFNLKRLTYLLFLSK